jgi:hypothetical protein
MRRSFAFLGLVATAAVAASVFSAVRPRKRSLVAQHAPPGYHPHQWGRVEEASHESFPASDPPSYSAGAT